MEDEDEDEDEEEQAQDEEMQGGGEEVQEEEEEEGEERGGEEEQEEQEEGGGEAQAVEASSPSSRAAGAWIASTAPSSPGPLSRSAKAYEVSFFVRGHRACYSCIPAAFFLGYCAAVRQYSERAHSITS